MTDHVTSRSVSRRAFLGITAGGTLGALTFGLATHADGEPLGLLDLGPPPLAAKPTVALVRDPSVWAEEGRKADPAKMQSMVERALCLATSEQDATAAWKSLVKPTDTVGIKINCLGGRGIATRPQLIDAVVAGLVAAGVPEKNIIVWERNSRSLKGGGYKVQDDPKKVRYIGTPSMNKKEHKPGGIPTKLSRIIADDCTVLINLPVMKTHGIAGISGAIKNWMGAIPNPRDFHGAGCRNVGDLGALKPIKKKTKITIMDALRPQYERGPGDYPRARWNWHGILASIDPVALDRVALDVIEQKRKEVRGKDDFIVKVPYLRRAAYLKLGQTNLKRIKIAREETA